MVLNFFVKETSIPESKYWQLQVEWAAQFNAGLTVWLTMKREGFHRLDLDNFMHISMTNLLIISQKLKGQGLYTEKVGVGDPSEF